ncbi:MAG: hypothetical protein PHU94_00850 [Bacilli bacterium]|nr:hypothetical protein [Bacilli bacterium]MDD4733326.1 hypothetical protein [Bacilli bacterium]
MKKVVVDVILFLIFDILMTSAVTLSIINNKVTFVHLFLTIIMFLPFVVLFIAMAINDYKKYKKGIEPVLVPLNLNKRNILLYAVFALFLIVYIIILVSFFSIF